MKSRYDIVVIGGGHAGIEACWAASCMGAEVALVTMRREAIGRMSCNPAIGGLGKGQIVREIDALGGLMGLAIDRAGIQFRMLNRSKGPAVWAPRAQADRAAYAQAVQELLTQAAALDVIEGSVKNIDFQEDGRPLLPDVRVATDARAESEGPTGRSSHGIEPRGHVTGVTLVDGRTLEAPVVVIAAGTFLRGLMHCGSRQSEGGRVGEAPAVDLSESLRAMGFQLGRLKTGTPPRIHRDSIDFDACTVQPGDEYPTPFSFTTDAITREQMDCWITWTNPQVHDLIRDNLHRAPMYSGQIQSTGPRYCPSIEDKVVRFADKNKHQIFLEPEGWNDERIYCNGISTSLPEDVQEAFVRGMPALRHAKILQHGYAVEHDWVPTQQTKSSLETKRVEGLFLAGQINGTSGYEEAAGQGFVAGVNAVQRLRGAPPLGLGRDQAYIGVMIDDLITRPISEPYRMFTSRAEYRLLLRSDNADERLTPIGHRLGTVDASRWARYEKRRNAVATVEALCRSKSVAGATLASWIRRPEVDVPTLADALHRSNRASSRPICSDVLEQVLVAAKYSGYVDRQARQIERFRRLESMALSERIPYGSIPGLRHEAREGLERIAPRTLGQAARIAGVTPSDIAVLSIYLSVRRRSESNVELGHRQGR